MIQFMILYCIFFYVSAVMKEKRNIGNNWNSDVAIYIVDLHHLEAIIILIFPQVNINFTEFLLLFFNDNNFFQFHRIFFVYFTLPFSNFSLSGHHAD